MHYDFESERLGFRRWKSGYSLPFQKMNNDKDVMEFMPKCLNSIESDQFIERINAHFKKYGHSLWAVEVKKTKEFIGYIGLYTAEFDAEFTPCTEIGWRLSKDHWNKGYATEGAIECLDFAFNVLNIRKIYSFTSLLNVKSINVMKKIGLCKESEFDHPNLKIGHPLRRHVLYSLENRSK